MHSYKYIKMMHFKVLFIFLYFSNGLLATETEDNDNEAHRNMSIYNISDILINLINSENVESNIRLEELRAKVEKIKKYVVDNEKVNKFVLNVTRETKLNETNFYKALLEEDHFRFITEKDALKSLYLKLKEKITRDDIMRILSNKDDKSDFMKSAQKAMYITGKTEKDVIDEVVDKMIAETPNDNHTYKASINDSKYWDPQNELQDLHNFHQHDGRRIYKGERTSIRYYPFMASVHVMGRFWCGGVIYWHDIVLTSASCLQLMHNNRFFRENPKVLEVRIGSNQSRIGGEMIEALEVYFHPGYSPKTLRNNIAIIRIRRHLYFNYHRIPKCIAISHNEDGIPDTAEVLLLGWGVTQMSQKMSYEPVFLQRKFLPIYPNKFCKEVYGDKFITSTMFCAGTMTTGEGACDHDAGGPAILSGKLVGIISFGPTICGYPNAPTVFTLVGAFADWIETINQSMPSYYRGKKRTTTTHRPLYDLLEDWPHNVRHIESMSWFTPVQLTTSHAPIDDTATVTQGGLRSPGVVGLKTGDDSEEGWSIDDDHQ